MSGKTHIGSCFNSGQYTKMAHAWQGPSEMALNTSFIQSLCPAQWLMTFRVLLQGYNQQAMKFVHRLYNW